MSLIFGKRDVNNEASSGSEIESKVSTSQFSYSEGSVDGPYTLSPEEDKRAAKAVHRCLSFNVAKIGDIEVDLPEREMIWLLQKAGRATLSQPTLLRLRAPIRIVGDIHGQYVDLLRVFELGGYPPEQSYLFLGDYVDRGRNGLECMMLLLALKVRFPNHIFMLRGNHECESINRVYGFFAECKRRFTTRTWDAHNRFFATLPIAAIIEERVFCIHGGLSPLLEDLNQIEVMERPLAVPPRGMLIDFLWSDPDADVRGWAESDRGISYNFGADVVKAFLRKHKFDLLVRAHQVVEAGYELFADRQLVTLFTAPNYCGEFDNAGAIMIVEKDLQCRFLIMAPRLKNGFHYAYDGRPKTPIFD